MRSISGWTLVGLAAVAFGPASAQVDPLAPRPAQPQAQPAPARPTVITPAPRTFYPQPAYAQPTGFAAYKQYLMAKARSQGIREATIQSTIPYLQLNSRAIELDRA